MTLIAHLSDTHVAAPGSPIDVKYATGDALARAVAHANALVPAPEAVLVTGDLTEEGSREEFRRLRGILAGLRAPVYLIPGNHDTREALAATFAAEQPWLPRGGGPVRYTADVGPIRLVALDTTIPGEAGGRVGADQLAWLEARLAEAPDRPTLVLTHHPPFTTGIAGMDEIGLEDAGALAQVVSRHPQVERVLSGHLHRPILRRFAGTLACTAPSTARQVGLDLGGGAKVDLVAEPPACLLHLWPDGPRGGCVTHVSLIAG
jgi:3',5'-cyclic AMP phosphodiesterase CpdA